MKIQDISPLKMINSIIRVPTENDLKDLSDKDFKKNDWIRKQDKCFIDSKEYI